MTAPERRGPGLDRMKRNLPDPEALRQQVLAEQREALALVRKRAERLNRSKQGPAR